MRIALRVSGIAFLGALALVGCATAAPSQAPFADEGPRPVFINIRGFAYVPATLEVVKGTKVTWTNEDTAPHTVTTGTPPPTPVPAPTPATASPAPTPTAPGATPRPSPSLPKGDGRVESARITTGRVFTFTFNEAGTYDYFCGVHPRMVATITVK